MKIIKYTPRPNGVTRLIIELQPDEGVRAITKGKTLLQLDEDDHYRLGQPMSDDVIAGHILANSKRVYWCSIEQKWRED